MFRLPRNLTTWRPIWPVVPGQRGNRADGPPATRSGCDRPLPAPPGAARLTPTENAETPSKDTAALPRFDGFPYLVTQLMSSLYHITLLPEDAPESTLMRLAQRQLGANKLDTCLVLASDRATFCWTDGRIEPTDVPPCGGTLLSWRLALSVDLLRTEDLVQRQEHLDRLVANGRAKGTYFFDNLVKGGRNGTREELERLNGTQAEGLPRGLAKCGQCGDWRGECLDADPTFAGIVMPVHCRCQNHNACARCGGRLYERRLNANFYDPRDRGIWHVPGLAIDHKCRTMVRATR